MQNSAQAAVDPQTKPPDLGCESACRQLSSTTTIAIYYAAVLRRRGRILRCTLSVRLSVCLSVCPSVPWLFTLEHRSRVFLNLADVRYLLFCLHVRAAYSTAISAAQACYYYSARKLILIYRLT